MTALGMIFFRYDMLVLAVCGYVGIMMDGCMILSSRKDSICCVLTMICYLGFERTVGGGEISRL